MVIGLSGIGRVWNRMDRDGFYSVGKDYHRSMFKMEHCNTGDRRLKYRVYCIRPYFRFVVITTGDGWLVVGKERKACLEGEKRWLC